MEDMCLDQMGGSKCLWLAAGKSSSTSKKGTVMGGGGGGGVGTTNRNKHQCSTAFICPMVPMAHLVRPILAYQAP